MTFIERVGKMAAHARPSKLRELSLRPRALLRRRDRPRVSPDGSKVIDCPANPTTGAPADVDAPTVTVQFVQAMDVPDAEMSRKISHALLRACLFDRGEFIGNVAVVPATRTTDAAQGVAAWRGEGDARVVLGRVRVPSPRAIRSETTAGRAIGRERSAITRGAERGARGDGGGGGGGGARG